MMQKKWTLHRTRLRISVNLKSPLWKNKLTADRYRRRSRKVKIYHV